MSQTPDPIPYIMETRLKEPLKKGWKYPVGAEIVTRGLEACPRRNEVRLYFWCHKAKRLEVGKPKVVLSARYSITRGGVGIWESPPAWDIYVEAVPREIAHRVRELLIADGLPQAAAWLSMSRTETWLDKRYGHRLDVEFDVESDELQSIERD